MRKSKQLRPSDGLSETLNPKISNPIRLRSGEFIFAAHHPHCNRYDNHLIWIRGHPLCLGCLSVSIGLVCGLTAFWLLDWQSLPFKEWISIVLALMLPTAIQPFFQFKPFKIFSRTSLGLAIPIYLFAGTFSITPPIESDVFVAILAALFVGSYFGMTWLRNKFTRNPCNSCPLGEFPTCEWNIENVLQEVNGEYDSFYLNT